MRVSDAIELLRLLVHLLEADLLYDDDTSSGCVCFGRFGVWLEMMIAIDLLPDLRVALVVNHQLLKVVLKAGDRI